MLNKNKLSPLVLIILGAALMLFAGLWLMRNAPPPVVTPTVLPSLVLPPTASAAQTPFLPERISLADAKAAFDAKQAVFLDVRSANSYAKKHISGAVSIPENELAGRLSELDPNAWIITYCT